MRRARIRRLLGILTGLAIFPVQQAAAQYGGDPEAGDLASPEPPPDPDPKPKAAPPSSPEPESEPEPAADSAAVDVRLAGQFRLSALNVVGMTDPGLADVGANTTVLLPYSFTPRVTAGIRLSERLFLGVGFGFFSGSASRCANNAMGCGGEKTQVSTSGWSLSPMASYDIAVDDDLKAALYFIGWVTVASGQGVQREISTSGSIARTDVASILWLGANVGLGIRAHLTRGLALGTEWGWGFATGSSDGAATGTADDRSAFTHGIWGNLLFEASVGL